MQIQALDSADNPIPGAVATSAEPVLYSQPGLMARASAWLRADPFRLIIVFVAIAALAVGIMAVSRMLRKDAAVAPLIPIETLKKPYGSKS